MKPIEVIGNAFRRWLDSVAEAAVALIARFMTPRTVNLIERESGRFEIFSADERTAAALRGIELRVEDGAVVGPLATEAEAMLRGSRVELTLQSNRFVFKPLELPARAAEFLDGIVRAQIDRLTPWSAELAAFGFSAPVDAGGGRLFVTVAATAKSMLIPFTRAFSAKGAQAVALLTRPPEADPKAPPIAVMEENLSRTFGIRAVRRILLIVLASCGFAAAAAAVAAIVINGDLDARQDELAQRITHQRVAALAARDTSGDPVAAAERALAKRKNETPSAVITLEVLSRILPDRTYVKEMRIEDSTLRLTGITDDAPDLIRLMERTPQFTQAIFSAPITHSPSDGGDRFNIEARLEPVFSPIP
jgi:general secretion pathway protein L